MLLSGRRLTDSKECRNPVLSTGVAPTIHQAMGIYMHRVILRMELEYQALGYNI